MFIIWFVESLKLVLILDFRILVEVIAKVNENSVLLKLIYLSLSSFILISILPMTRFNKSPPSFPLLFSCKIRPYDGALTGIIPNKSPPPPLDKPLVLKAEELIFNFFVPIREQQCSPFRTLPVDE